MKHSTLRILITIILASSLTGCHVFRSIFWGGAGRNDYKSFPASVVKRSDSTFNFIKTETPFEIANPEQASLLDANTFDSFLKKTKTIAFIVIRNDSLIYEAYPDGDSTNSIFPSFSVAKSFVSALIGIAIDEGYINSESDSITKYLTELRGQGLERVTIRDLLNMRAGLNYKETYLNPFGDASVYYFGINLKKAISKLKCVYEPNSRYEYQSAATLLLSLTLEAATKQRVSDYLSIKIWQPLGMQSDASWSFDSMNDSIIKSFCCLNATALDFARFGRLWLNRGKWNGRRIISEQYINRALSDTLDSKDSQNYPYSHQWRPIHDGSFFAKGVLGQYIFVNPTKKMIIVRLGRKSDKINWAKIFREIKIHPLKGNH